MLVEEFLDGPEISVETLSDPAGHHVVAVTEKFVGPGFVETGHLVPARIPAADRERAARLAVDTLVAVGLVEGPAHTEIRLTSRGPRVVESHSRPGGDHIDDLVRLACGVDLIRAAVAVALGLSPELAPGPGTGAAAIGYVVPPPGRVTSLAPLDPPEPGTTTVLTARVGDVVPPLRRSADRVCGYVIAQAPDAERAARACAEAVRRVTVATVAIGAA